MLKNKVVNGKEEMLFKHRKTAKEMLSRLVHAFAPNSSQVGSFYIVVFAKS